MARYFCSESYTPGVLIFTPPKMALKESKPIGHKLFLNIPSFPLGVVQSVQVGEGSTFIIMKVLRAKHYNMPPKEAKSPQSTKPQSARCTRAVRPQRMYT